MKIKLASVLLAVFALSPLLFFAQRGKDGNYTVTATNTVVNSYTYLTANASAGATSITVNSNAMAGGAFAGNLAAGDLIMIIQMQGASMDINTTPTVSWGGNYTVPEVYFSVGWNTNPWEWGQVTAINNAGKYEQVEVLSVSGTNTINLSCGLQNAYVSAGHVQIVRVPRFNNLTLNASTTVVPTAWGGQVGGVVAIEVNGNLVLNASSKITASGRGFRGAVADNVGSIGTTTQHTNGNGNGATHLGSYSSTEGARKGEGVGGFTTEYDALSSRYGRGAPANGGGGGGYQNAGGGGGSNVGSGAYTGKGVPSTTFAATYWNLELAGFAGTTSPGGGRGGYSLSSSDQNELTLKPNSTAWGGDARKENGGLGGHPLTYDATRLFMGGGGGAGDQDQGQGGAGGNGGGIVHITCYGTISGTGSIESDGAVGQNTNPTNQPVNPFPSSTNKKGNDGAGGGGGGGAIYIKNATALPAGVSLLARGGNGGNQVITLNGAPWEASGTGGAGGGGSVAFTSGTPTQSVAGGTSGTTNSTHVSNFNVNGGTNGAAGIASSPTTIYNITATNASICAGASATLTATVTGTTPGALSWYTQQFGGSAVATGNSYTPTPTPATTTTYWVGVCPGTFRIPVTLTINPNPVIAGTAVLTNPSCSTPGSITGLTVSGGTPGYTYSWSGTTTAGPDYTNIPAGTYTLTVSDLNGCTDTDGPHTLIGVAGPIINAAGVAIQNESCNGTMGSISGITATGVATLTYSWSNSGGTNLNATNLVTGSYTLTVTDGNGCTATSGPHTVGFIAGPTVDATAIVITPATCGNANGAISGITATGTGLSYAWNGTASVSTSLSGQNGGNYTLVVTDVNGCTASTGPHIINSISGPTIDASAVAIVNENCNLGNGSISGITVSGGTPAYTIAWSGTAQTSLNITNLSAGSYTLTVTDQNLCTATAGPFTVSNLGAPVINAAAAVVQDQSCTGTMGSITGITASGTPTLTYSWSNGGGSALNASNLVAGSYTLTVTDGNGCTANSGPYTVGFVTGPTVDPTGITITPSTCGNANGEITGITAAGTALTYTWNGTASASTSLTGQNGGNYTLVVTDGNGCTVSSGPHTIPSIAGPTVNTTSMTITSENCNQANGSIVGIAVSGGTPGYSYTWSGTTQTTLDISTLTAGVYSLTVTDQNLCTATVGPFTVNNAGGPSIDETNAVSTNVLCDGTLGTISGITATGTALNYSWSNGGGSALNANNLAPGSYVLTITDGNGCSITSGTYTILTPVPLAIDATNMVVTQTSCTANTGSISGIVVTGGINPVNSWSNSASTLNISNLAAGNYTLTVTDDQGCSDDLTVSITLVNAPVINTAAMVITNEHCGQNDATVSGITVSSGTPAYTYAWNTSPVTNTIDLIDVSSGTWTLTVTDAQGCSDTETITINETSGPVVDATNIVVTQLTCTTSGSINGLVVNGANPYTYAWTGTTQTTLDIVGLAVGTYTLTVTDANGCTGQYGPTTLVQPAGPSASFTWTPEIPDVNENVSISNTSTGINITDYLWTVEGQNYTTEDVNYAFAAEGDYPVTLMITDGSGCMDTVTQIISIYGVLVIPNVMTINGDNVNETFEIKGLKPNTNLIIVNRWGNLVFQTDDYQNDWDGKDYSGNDLTEGVYTYLLKGVDGKEEHGFIHLIR